METTIQKLRKQTADIDRAIIYYSILSLVNNIGLTKRQIQLLAFTAVRGGITNPAAKQDFCEKYDSSPGTINNIIKDLKKVGIFVKKGSKIAINPAISLNFKNNLILQIKLDNES